MLRVILCLGVLFSPVVAWAQRPDLLAQTGHSATVNAVALSGEGQWLASAGEDGSVRVWETATGLEFRVLRGHREGVDTVAWSRDDKILASGGIDKGIKLWDVATGRLAATLEGHGGFVNALAFSPDGKTLVSGSTDKTIKIWDYTAGRLLHSIEAHADSVDGLCFSPDGKLLASGGDRTAKLWDTATWREVRRFPFGKGVVNALAFSPDGKTLAFGNDDTSDDSASTVNLHDLATGRRLRALAVGTPYVFDCAFSPDGKTLAIANEDSGIQLWEAATGKPLRVLAGHKDAVKSLLYAADGRLISGSFDSQIRVWDTGTGRTVQLLAGATSPLNATAMSSDGKLLASGNEDYSVTLWRLAETQQPQRLAGHTNVVTAVAFSSDGKMLASGSVDYEIRLWRTDNGREALKFDADKEHGVSSLAFSPDGKTLASSPFFDKTVKTWDAATGRALLTLPHVADVNCVRFSPDGTLLAGAAGNGLIRLWDAKTGALRREMTAGEAYNSLNSLAFSPDGQTLAAGGKDVKLWDVATGRLLRAVERQPVPGFAVSGSYRSNAISPVAFSRDGKTLAGGGQDGVTTLWNTADGRFLRVLAGHRGNVASVAFTPDGRALFTGGDDDATLRLWDTAQGRELAQLITTGVREGLIVTPDGLFDGAPAAWGKILWRFSPALRDVSPVEIFFNEFFYPNLLEELLTGRRPQAAQGIERKDRRQPLVSLSLAETSAGTSRTVTARIKVTDTGGGARDARLFRNGALVKAWRGKALLSATLETPVTLTAGPNQLTAYAFNQENVKSRDATLNVTGAESLRRPPVLHILSIGVNQYANAAFNLRYAVADAESLAAEIPRQQTGMKQFARVNAKSLLDAQATKQNILSALKELARQAQPEDTALLFFAGHGLADEPRFYLIPHDLGYAGPRAADAIEPEIEKIFARGISDEELEQALESLDAGRVLLVIDACNSGQALEAEEKRRGPMNSRGLAQLAYEKGMYILTAAQSYQAALEAAQFGHGLLTFALVEEGLKAGRADTEPADGQIISREWFNFATARVPQLQLEKMKQSRNLGLAFVEGDEKIKDVDKRNLQRPRAFYRRETEAAPFIVGRAKTQ